MFSAWSCAGRLLSVALCVAQPAFAAPEPVTVCVDDQPHPPFLLPNRDGSMQIGTLQSNTLKLVSNFRRCLVMQNSSLPGTRSPNLLSALHLSGYVTFINGATSPLNSHATLMRINQN